MVVVKSGTSGFADDVDLECFEREMWGDDDRDESLDPNDDNDDAGDDILHKSRDWSICMLILQDVIHSLEGRRELWDWHEEQKESRLSSLLVSKSKERTKDAKNLTLL